MTDLRQDSIMTYSKPLDGLDFDATQDKWLEIENRLWQQFKEDGVDETIIFSRFVDIRYSGQEHTVKIPVPNGRWVNETLEHIKQSFHEQHEKIIHSV